VAQVHRNFKEYLSTPTTWKLRSKTLSNYCRTRKRLPWDLSSVVSLGCSEVGRGSRLISGNMLADPLDRRVGFHRRTLSREPQSRRRPAPVETPHLLSVRVLQGSDSVTEKDDQECRCQARVFNEGGLRNAFVCIDPQVGSEALRTRGGRGECITYDIAAVP